MLPRIHTLSIGTPKDYEDERGIWQSAIGRQSVSKPVYLDWGGHVGDKVADTKNHGSPDQAVCCHPLEHYHYWNERYGLSMETGLSPGAVGENWTIVGANEKSICIGSTYRVGDALVQVSGPRFPCSKQERKVKIPGFLQEVARTMRSGFYMRVLLPGEVEVGDALEVVDCPHPDVTVADANACIHEEIDPTVAERVLAAEELNDFWRRIIQHSLDTYREQPSLF
ncbi:MAG TPA: MOSC domain-containing protein [Capsulimonadaceae bacterium]|jgi:MOSC domain-containing protein YiiM